MGILDDVKNQVEQMDAEAVKAELQKMLLANEKRKEKQVQYNSSPEAKAKRTEYSKKYNADRLADPEKREGIIAKRKEYHSRPEVKEKQKAYRTRRNDLTKALMNRAKELGIDLKGLAAEKMASPSA